MLKINKQLLKTPSFIATATSGIIILIIIIISLRSYRSIQKLSIYEKLMLLMLFSITICIHGIAHLGLEAEYDYNPLQ